MADPYATATEVRAYDPKALNVTEITDDYLAGLVSEFEDLAEEYVGVSYVTRTAVETIRAGCNGAQEISLRHRPVLAITSITIDGVAVSTSSYYFTGRFVTYRNALWPYIAGQVVVVTYTYGYATAPPAALKRACLEYVRSIALLRRSGVSRDVISSSSADGGTTRYSTADREHRRPTGYLGVDQVLNNLLDRRMPAIA